LAAGEYLTINYLVRKSVEGFTGWLTISQFLTIYPKVLAEGPWIMDVVFYVVALAAALGQLQPLKLRPRS